MSSKRKISRKLLACALTLSAGLGLATGAWAQERTREVVDPGLLSLEAAATSSQLERAIIRNNTAALCQASCTLNQTSSVSSEVFTQTIQGFPTNGTSFGLLSTGDASLAPNDPFTNFADVNFGANPDKATLKCDFQLGNTPGNLTFDYKYGTEENPEYLGDIFQDPFTATLDPGAIILASLTVDTAAPISNAPGGTSSSAPLPPGPTPDDTVYNAMTTATQVVTQNLGLLANQLIAVTLDMRDAGDDNLDTAVFLDNMRIDGCDTVGIDIKAGSFPNSINLDSGGNTPVAILGSDVLDVTKIDPASVMLADAGVRLVGKPTNPKEQCSIQDVSGDFSMGPEGLPDGYPDLVCHMETAELGPLDCTTTTAEVKADYNGILITGSDSVNIVKDGVSCQP